MKHTSTLGNNTMRTEKSAPASKLLNVRIPADFSGRLEALSKATGRTKSAIMMEALRSYVDAEMWQIQEIQDGIDEANRGEFASEEEVTTFFARYGC